MGASAFSVTTIGAISTYNGLHVLNTRTGRDRHLPGDGFDIDWSPDGSRFAYVEFTHLHPVGSIYMVAPTGQGTRVLKPGARVTTRRLPGLPAARDWRTRRTLPGSIRLAPRPLRVGGRRGRQRSASGREKRGRSCLVAQRPHDRLPRFLRDQVGYARGQGRDAADRGPSLSRYRSRWPAGLVTRRPKDRDRKQAGCLRDERRRLEPFDANLGRPHRHLRVLPADVATTTALGEAAGYHRFKPVDDQTVGSTEPNSRSSHPEPLALTVKPPPAALGAAHLSRCFLDDRLHVLSSIADAASGASDRSGQEVGRQPFPLKSGPGGEPSA